MKLSTLASVTLLTLGASGVVHAQGGAHVSFATADTDKDGRLSVEELQEAMPDVEIDDEDDDGYVSRSEAEASITGLSFEGDEDGDGNITETEYDAIVAQLGMDDDESPTRGLGAGDAGAGRAGAGGAAVGAGAGGGAGAGDAEGDTDN